MNSRMMRIYQRERRKGTRAETALAIAKQNQRDEEMGWEGTNENDALKRAVVEQDGLRFVVTVEYDYDADNDSAGGHFARSWEPNAVNSTAFQCAYYDARPLYRKPRRLARRRNNKYIEYGGWSRRTSDERYWVPDEPLRKIAASLSRAGGYARHEAYLKAWEQIREDEQLAAGNDISYYIVNVTAYFHDIELSQHCCGSVGINDDESYLTEVAEELIAEARSEAREHIERVRTQLISQLQSLEAL